MSHHTPANLAPGLYIVATPIGNLGDVTLRAVEVLQTCDAVACEDTRVTGKLLRHLNISKPMWRYDDHAGENERTRMVEAMQSRAIALVSDAGTPLVSDPGYRLVRDARAAGVSIVTLPGACAAIAGITLSGLPSDRFLFAGFLPAKEKARAATLGELAEVPATLIFYETAPRLGKSLATIAQVLPGREVAVARELTKLYEECRTGTAADLLAHYAAHPPKGEIVLMVGRAPEVSAAEFDVDALLGEALETMKPSQAVAYVGRITGHERKALYARALALRAP